MKVDRLVSIIMILLEKKRIGAQELADRFEVSPRTIYRDIDAINAAGIPVRSMSGVGGGFEIMPEYKMDKRIFSTAELSALLMGLTNLSGMVRGEELLSALAKVRSFVPADKAKEIDLMANQICIDLHPWMGNRNIQSNLETIQTALQENRLLSFAYVDGHGNQTGRIVEPYQLVLKGSHWYFQGYPISAGLSPVPAVPHFQSANEGGDLCAPGVSETDSRLFGSAGSYADKNQASDSQVDSGPGSGFLCF